MASTKSRLKFWVDVGLAIAILYIIVFYFFTKPNNLCQMTFMMEPPKFLPVPIELDKESIDQVKSSLRILGQEPNRNLYLKSDYILYMYSEFGFPQTSNIERDLKDSMPVLFVPGSAGSYQQVRSLASTCIRYQLQSLKASKFAFYTIDFNDEHSGIDGETIEEQTFFVDKAIKQILKLHTNETTGVILIGHSVGGFISKALFALPGFDSETVPLLINLASPLTSSHLYFDEKTKELYDKTNLFWNHNKSNISATISISISGGRLDRLVPTHLSMDTHYDLCLTTSSIKDVWLDADHVSITWCRELMQKLAALLSALMDKRNTRLISDKSKALSIIEEQLLSRYDKSSELPVINKDWKSLRPYKLIKFQDFYSATRTQLSEIIIILEMTDYSEQDILIHIDHIESLKSNGLFVCRNFKQLPSGHINCDEKIDLMHIAELVPSRKYEAKKTVIKLPKDVYHEYLIIDFVNTNDPSYSTSKLPELLTIQNSEFSQVTEMYIPHLVEYILNKFVLFNSYEQKIITMKHDKTAPMAYRKYKILELNHESKVFTLKFQSQACRNIDGQSRGSTIVLSENNYLLESFHPGKHDLRMSVTVKLDNQKIIVSKMIEEDQPKETHLEFYLDGSCSSHKFELELDVFDLVIAIIQKNLNQILLVTLLLALMDMFRIELELCRVANHGRKCESFRDLRHLLNIMIPVILFFQRSRAKEHSLDRFAIVVTIYLLAAGLTAFIKSFTSRIVDVAIVVQKGNLLLSKTIHNFNRKEVKENKLLQTNGTSKPISKDNNVELTLMSGFLIPTLATMISPSFGMLSLLLILVMNKLKLQEKFPTKVSGNSCCNNHLLKEQNNHDTSNSTEGEELESKKRKFVDCVDDMIECLMIWCIFFIIYAIPSALIDFELANLLSIKGIQKHLIKNRMILLFTLNVYMRMSRLESLMRVTVGHEKGNSKKSSGQLLHSFLVHLTQLLLIGNFLINYIGYHEGTFWLCIPYVNFHLLWVYLAPGHGGIRN